MSKSDVKRNYVIKRGASENFFFYMDSFNFYEYGWYDLIVYHTASF